MYVGTSFFFIIIMAIDPRKYVFEKYEGFDDFKIVAIPPSINIL